MGLMDFLGDCIIEMAQSDILNGRFTPLDEVLRSVVECAGYRVKQFLFKTGRNCSDYHRQLEIFLVHQLVMLCEAKSILHIHNKWQIYLERPSRAIRVYAAMRHEFDKRKDSESYYPTFRYAFRDALPDITSISGMDFEERMHLGFNIFEEYHNILPTVSKFIDPTEFESFYSDYVVKIHDMAFQCFITEDDRLAEESCQREQASFAGEIVRFKPTAERLEEIHSDWRAMVYDTYRMYDTKMECVRVSDVSKDFDRFWRTKMRSH